MLKLALEIAFIYIGFLWVCGQVKHIARKGLPRWICAKSTCQHENLFSQTTCSACSNVSPHVLPAAPDSWRREEVWKCMSVFRSNIDALDGTQLAGRGCGVGGTIRTGVLLAALGVVPLEERANSMFWDIGCGHGYVLVAAMVYGFAFIAGLEQNNFEKEWEMRLARAKEVKIGSPHQECWTQVDPYVLWNSQVRDLAGLEQQFQRYRWHKNVIIYLFWTTWDTNDKETVLLFIGKHKFIVGVYIVDECQRKQGHKRTCRAMFEAGFVIHKYRTGCRMSRSTGSESFAVVYWKRA